MTAAVFKLSKLPCHPLAVTLSVVLFPALTLVVQRSTNACFAFLLLYCLIYLGLRAKPLGTTAVFNKFWPLHLSMASMFGAILVSQLASGAISWRVFDTPLRLALFAPVFWILLSLPARHLQKVQWGFVVGAILAVVQIYILTARGTERIPIIGFTNAIPYGDISLLLGACSLLSLGWSHRRAWLLNGVRFAGAAAGAYASFLSQSRGGWLAIPFFIALGLIVTGRPGKSFKIRVSIVVSALILLGSIAMFSKTVQSRFVQARADINDFHNGKNLDSSVGNRFQLWNGSWVIFREHPLLGVGREHFSGALDELVERSIITKAAAEYSHSHNEILFNMATLGLFGLAAILLTYLLPAAYFFSYLKNKDRQIVTGATIGLATCIGFAFFGLTETMFVVSMTSAFYTLAIATSLAFIVRREQEFLSLER